MVVLGYIIMFHLVFCGSWLWMNMTENKEVLSLLISLLLTLFVVCVCHRKFSLVKPLLKKGDKSCVANYRLKMKVLWVVVLEVFPSSSIDCSPLSCGSSSLWWSFKMLVTVCLMTWCNNSEDLNLQQLWCGNHRSHKLRVNQKQIKIKQCLKIELSQVKPYQKVQLIRSLH